MIPCELVTSERPLVSHTVGKEDKYLLNKLIPPVDAEVSCLQFRVVVFDQEYCSGVEFYQSTNDEDDAILTEQIVERFEIGKCQSEGVDDKKADQCMVKAEQKMVQEIIKTKTVFLLKNETQ
eukprot:Em0018g1146a